MDKPSREIVLNNHVRRYSELEEESMRLSRLFALVVLLTGAHCLAQTPSEATTAKTSPLNGGYSLTIATLTGPAHLGAPINITITVKNVSNSDIYWRAELGSAEYHAFRFSLKKSGKEVGKTRFHRILGNELRPEDQPETASGSGSSIVSALEPGKSFALTIDLNKLYEITEPGEYTLDISRTEEDNKTTGHSNTVTLEIVQ
jgi:hypothetical protein